MSVHSCFVETWGGNHVLYGAGVNVSTSKFMGRWSVEGSLERYIQVAMAVQIMNHLPVKAVIRLKKIAALCISLVWSGELVSGIEDPRLLNSKNCLAGGWTMQSLIDKYRSRTVQGGALSGSQFGQLSDEQLK